jgi:hypothetical protein
MDAAFMSFRRRGWGIHVVSAEPELALWPNHQSWECYGSTEAPRVTPTIRAAGPKLLDIALGGMGCGIYPGADGGDGAGGGEEDL